jgi:hypothetical protein
MLNNPRSTAVDAAGDVFIADFINSRVREIVKATGAIITVAGTGSTGYSGDGGPATSARLYYPTGVALDASGNLYIADLYNNRIREVVKSTGAIITIAGNGMTSDSGDGGPATSAGIAGPWGVAVDGSGNVFIADYSGQRVREVVKSTGIIITVAGNGTAGYTGDGGPATSAELYAPYGVAVDSNGNLFIADSNNQRIREVVKATGKIITFAGIGAAGYGGDNGPAAAARLYNPSGVAVDQSGNVFIADTSNYRVREVTQATGLITTVAGSGTFGYGGDGGPATAANVGSVYGLAVDQTGNLYLADTTNSAVREVLANSLPVPGPLSITAWTTNQPGFSSTSTITGGTAPYSLTSSSLPLGLTASLSGSTVTISGTLTGVGTVGGNFAIRDANGNSANRSFTITINPTPALGALTPAQWTAGRPGYTGVVSISGGTGPFTVAAQSNLPPGLNATVSGTSLLITGTPTTAGTFSNAQVKVDDTTGAATTGTYSLTINPAPTLGSLSTTAWTLNQPGYSGTIGIAGGTAPFSGLTVSGLPAGLTASLSGSTVTISGTPTAGGTFGNISVSLHDSAGATATGTFGITMNPAANLGALSSSVWTVGQPGFSGSIVISGGTAPYGSLTFSGLPAGLTASLSGNSIVVSGTPTTSGVFTNVQIGVLDAAGLGASQTYTITINAAPTLGALAPLQWTVGQAGYVGVAPVSGGTGPFTLAAQSNLPPGLTAAVSGASVVITGTPTATGTFGAATVAVQDADGATATGTFAIIVNAAPTLGSLSASTWTVNQPGFSGVIGIAGGTGSFSGLTVSGLPAGLTASLSGNSIVVSGAPTAAGVFSNANFSVMDSTGATASAVFTLTINAAPTLGALTTGQWTAGVAGYPGTFSITGGTGPFSVVAQSNVPSGLTATVNGTSAVFAGTPTTAGTYGNVRVTVQDAAGAIVSGVFAITVEYAGPVLISLAGTGTAGYSGDGGAAISSQLSAPANLAVDGSGNVFIADTGNNVVREIVKATGTIVTVAGSGAAGYSGDNGPATTAELSAPTGIAVDAIGDVFIADTGNNVVREVVQATGNIVTVAGNGAVGYSGDGATASAAQLSAPAGVAVDAIGDIFIADTGNNVVREVVQATGNMVTVAGTSTAGYGGDGGPATLAQLSAPAGVAVDGSGNLFIADAGNNVVREVVQSTGNILTVAGTGTAGYSGDGGTAIMAQLSAPTGVAVDGSGDLFIADTGNNVVREVVQSTGDILTVAGGSQLRAPAGVVADGGGDLFIADTANNRVRELLSVSPPSLGALSGTAWTVNQSGFSAAIPISGGLAPFGNLTVSGLPAGVTASLSGSSITLSGTPTTTGPFCVNVTVTDAAGAVANAGYQITVNPAPALGSLSQGQWEAGQAGYNGAIPVMGGTGPFTIVSQSNLPPGLTAVVSGPNIVFTGTPTAAGTFGSMSVTMQDVTGATASGTFSITINPAATLGSLSSTAWTVNQPGYSGTINITGGDAPFGGLTVSGLPAGLTASVAGSIITLSGTPTAAGAYGNISLSITDAAGVTSTSTFNITINAAPAFGSLSSGQWTVGQAGFNGVIPVGGGTGALILSAQSNLPPGLSAALSGTNIIFNGTPTTAGTYFALLTVSDSTGAASTGTFSITVNPAPTLGALAASASAWTVNQPYSTTISVSGGTGTLSGLTATGLPPGLAASLSGNIITLSGTPTTAGYYSQVTLGVVDATGASVTRTYIITINAAMTMGSLTQDQWQQNEPSYPGTITVNGGTPAWSFASATGLPPGLSVNLRGGIASPLTVYFTGTPNTVGTYNMQITVQDAAGATVSGTFSLIITVPPLITTIAGTGTAGYSGDGGPATSAQVNMPWGVAVDSSGNIFFGDQNNNRVREIVKATGNVITVAGNGVAGFSGDGGPATSAELNTPYNVALDAAGDLFIADGMNNRIREVVKATGNIITVAGSSNSVSGGDGGPATSAGLFDPFGIVLDSSGNLYIGDYANERIREVSAATGIITTIAGNGTKGSSGDGGPATSAELYGPIGLAVDGSGNVFIADTYNSRIREVVKATGIITTVVGTGVNGYNGDGLAATATQISYAEGLALDSSGDLFFADGINNRIREVVNGPGTVITVAGNGNYGYSGDGGPAVAAKLYAPRGIALDASGNLYLADQNNNRIREILSGSIGPQMALVPGPSGASSVGQTLTSADLSAIVAEAIRRWAAAGLSAAQVARLQAVQFVVTGLRATMPGDVGWSLNGVVELDATAAGYGWYVDPTAQSDTEFGSGAPPAGMDLLTVVMHELGHQLGLQDLNDVIHPNDLMSEGLTPGVRRAFVSTYDRQLLGLPSLEALHSRR